MYVETNKDNLCTLNYLIASDDMDDDHHVGRGDEPGRPLQRDEDVVADVAPEGPVSEERDGEVAGGGDEVRGDGALPHGRPGRLGGRRRDGGLDLQHHAVPRVRERHLPQRAEHPERRVRRRAGLVRVAHPGHRPARHARRPRDGRVAARNACDRVRH